MDAGWDELERLAAAASANDAQIANEYPTPETIQRWKTLFGYSHVEAVSLIRAQREDVTREHITDDHWSLIEDEKQALGYNREAYEHSLKLSEVFKTQSATIPTTSPNGGMMLLFRLGGLLDSAEKVKNIAGLDEAPVVVEGVGDRGPVKFCMVGKETQKKLEEWLVAKGVLGE